MSTFLRNKTISKTTPLRKENPFPQFNVASYKRPGIRLSFEYTTTLLSGEGEEGRTGTATMFRKMLQVYNFLNSFVQDCSLVCVMNQFNIELDWKFTLSPTPTLVDRFRTNNTLIYSHKLLRNVAWYKHLFWSKVQFLPIAFVSCSVTCTVIWQR